jgi:hypothetical protein
MTILSSERGRKPSCAMAHAEQITPAALIVIHSPVGGLIPA